MTTGNFIYVLQYANLIIIIIYCLLVWLFMETVGDFIFGWDLSLKRKSETKP